jgi:hypothetical protein
LCLESYRPRTKAITATVDVEGAFAANFANLNKLYDFHLVGGTEVLGRFHRLGAETHQNLRNGKGTVLFNFINEQTTNENRFGRIYRNNEQREQRIFLILFL